MSASTRENADFASWEIAAAVTLGLSVQLGFGLLILWAKPSEMDFAEVDKQQEQPVRVMPVLDEEALQTAKLGGKKAVLPDMWQRAPASIKKAIQDKPAPPPDVAAPSPKADESPESVPSKDKKTRTVDSADPVEETPSPGASTGLASATASVGSPSLDATGGPENGTGGPGCVGEGCTKDGKLDDFQAGQYQGRLISFFKRGFAVKGLGLPPEEIKKLSVSVSVQLSGDGTVSSFTMSSSGNATFDSAARSSLQAKVGQPVPNPPEERPDLRRNSLSFSMTCGSGCN